MDEPLVGVAVGRGVFVAVAAGVLVGVAVGRGVSVGVGAEALVGVAVAAVPSVGVAVGTAAALWQAVRPLSVNVPVLSGTKFQS